MPPRTFEALYCESQRCTPVDFQRQVFSHCLYRHALPWVPILRLFRPQHFLVDRTFVADAGRARDIAEIRREVAEFFTHPNNRGWLRRRLNIRVSAGRLIELAEKYLPPKAG